MKELVKAKSSLYEQGITKEESEKRLADFFDLYYRERERYDKSRLAKLTLKQRAALHKLLLPVIKISGRLTGRKCEIVYDKRKQSSKPKVFAVTHIGRYDVEVASEAVKEHYCFFTNGFEAISRTADEFILALNGVVYFNHLVKPDRKAAAEKITEVLKSGGNIMIFPEGAYNITPNLPLMALNWGVIEIAFNGGAEIVPVAIEKYGNRYKVCIDSFDMNISECSASEKTEAIAALRDKFAQMKLDIWESEPRLTYREAKKIDWDKNIADIFKGGEDTADDVERERYHPKNICEYKEAFEHLSIIEKNHRTAFLFSKRNR